AGCPDPHPGPTVVPDPADRPPVPQSSPVTITSVDLVLAAVPGTDGSLWLVPAYRLTGDDGSTSTVLGIDESFIAPPPGPTPSSPTVATAIAPLPAPVTGQTPASSSVPDTTIVEPCPSGVVDCHPGDG
ncbi:MAG: hypothetical protein ACXWCM_06495, partial [Acidimicrobiales bacterium]